MRRVAACLSFLTGLYLGQGIAPAYPQSVVEEGAPYAVALTCDAREAVLEARLVLDPAEIELLSRGQDAADPLRVTVLDEGGFELFNTEMTRRFGEPEQVSELDSEGADLVAIVSQPTRLFCSAQNGEFWASGEIVITRSPGNLNPMGRCGATELVTATLIHKGGDPVELSLVGDCHFGGPSLARIVLDLKSGEVLTEELGE